MKEKKPKWWQLFKAEMPYEELLFSRLKWGVGKMLFALALWIVGLIYLYQSIGWTGTMALMVLFWANNLGRDAWK